MRTMISRHGRARGPWREVVGEAGAAHERGASIGHEKLAMIPQQVAEALARLERVEEAQLHSRLDHAPPVGARQPE